MQLIKWKQLLNISDCEEFSIETTLDLPNQRVILSDVERTRSSHLTPSEKSNLELLLTFYCKEFNTSYKQGMNEIMAPFLLMSREGLPLHLVYLSFKSFLHQYLPTMYADHSFKPLQGMFIYFKLLLRYFEPRLSTFFVVNNIEPQSFVTSWYLTLYSGKISSLSTLYYLWEEIIKENDVIFSVYLSIAIILDNRDLIACCKDKIVPQVISQIPLEDADKLSVLIANARNLKNSLPFSVLLHLNQLDIFNLDKIDSLLDKLQKEACLTLWPMEILHRAYPEIDICDCEQADCVWKTERGHNIPLVLIDCRTEKERQQGVLPNSILLESQAYLDSEFMLNFPDKFVPMRNIFHFCLMGSNEYSGQNFDLTTYDKPSNDLVQNMLENLLQVFLMKGFPYISVLDGGYKKAHDLAIKLDIQLENHSAGSCWFCARDGRKLENVFDSKIDEGQVPRKIKSEPFEHTDGENELVNKKIRKSLSDKFLFICQHLDPDPPEECMINVSNNWFGISSVTNELIQENFRVKISGLQKLTILKKDPKMISIKFAEYPKDLCFMMKSVEDAKLCVSQITKYFQISLNFPEFL